jgi:WD40 repeat protein
LLRKGGRPPAVSPDGRSVLTGGDTRVILWDASDGKIIWRFDGHSGLLSRVSFLPDGKRVISSSYDKTIRLWDLQTGKEIYRFVGHPGKSPGLRFRPTAADFFPRITTPTS